MTKQWGRGHNAALVSGSHPLAFPEPPPTLPTLRCTKSTSQYTCKVILSLLVNQQTILKTQKEEERHLAHAGKDLGEAKKTLHARLRIVFSLLAAFLSVLKRSFQNQLNKGVTPEDER